MREGHNSEGEIPMTETTKKPPSNVVEAMEAGDVPISEELSDRMKALFLKSVGERSSELENKRAAKDNDRIAKKLEIKNRF